MNQRCQAKDVFSQCLLQQEAIIKALKLHVFFRVLHVWLTAHTNIKIHHILSKIMHLYVSVTQA